MGGAVAALRGQRRADEPEVHRLRGRLGQLVRDLGDRGPGGDAELEGPHSRGDLGGEGHGLGGAVADLTGLGGGLLGHALGCEQHGQPESETPSTRRTRRREHAATPTRV